MFLFLFPVIIYWKFLFHQQVSYMLKGIHVQTQSHDRVFWFLFCFTALMCFHHSVYTPLENIHNTQLCFPASLQLTDVQPNTRSCSLYMSVTSVCVCAWYAITNGIHNELPNCVFNFHCFQES